MPHSTEPDPAQQLAAAKREAARLRQKAAVLHAQVGVVLAQSMRLQTEWRFHNARLVVEALNTGGFVAFLANDPAAMPDLRQ